MLRYNITPQTQSLIIRNVSDKKTQESAFPKAHAAVRYSYLKAVRSRKIHVLRALRAWEDSGDSFLVPVTAA